MDRIKRGQKRVLKGGHGNGVTESIKKSKIKLIMYSYFKKHVYN